MKKRLLVSFLFALGILRDAKAQTGQDSINIVEVKKVEKKTILSPKDLEIVQMIQLWDVNTFESAASTGNEKRNDLYIRRGRIGVRGKLRNDLSFNVVFAYDGIGRDKNTAGQGLVNDGDNRDFYLWDAFWTWSYKPMLNITAGFFRPQFSRENITAAFNVISFEKSLVNFQPRNQLIGRNTGREVGLNIGGLYLKNGWSINYNIGAFDMTSDKIVGTGKRWYPMLVSRAAFTIGDPEMDNYRLSYFNSYYGERKGITFAINGTYQGQTEIFNNNGLFGGDILANYGPFDFVAEYDWLYRSTIDKTNAATNTIDKVSSYRLGYNYKLKNDKIIQAAVMYSLQNGDRSGANEHLNGLTNTSDQELYDIGINYLLNKDKLKFNLHYVWGKRQDKEDSKYAYMGAGFQYLF